MNEHDSMFALMRRNCATLMPVVQSQGVRMFCEFLPPGRVDACDVSLTTRNKHRILVPLCALAQTYRLYLLCLLIS